MEKAILNLRKMAGFRRMVNRNFIDNTEMPYEDSQDPWQSGEETNRRSPSLLSNNPPRTSTPKAYNFAPFQFNPMSMYQPLQGQRTHFQPSFLTRIMLHRIGQAQGQAPQVMAQGRVPNPSKRVLQHKMT